ncbi:MAG: hypothetical protein DMF46_08785 [Verrucomicrobia bacterium]|nr:MAG: hypothetical protein DMF46_08785 [Verrucomicrobiota bacterium]
MFTLRAALRTAKRLQLHFSGFLCEVRLTKGPIAPFNLVHASRFSSRFARALDRLRGDVSAVQSRA